MKKKKGGKNAGYNGHHPPVSNTRYFWHYLFSERFAFMFCIFFSRYVESLAKTPKGDFVIAKDKILGRKGGIAFFSTGPGKSKDLRGGVGPW